MKFDSNGKTYITEDFDTNKEAVGKGAPIGYKRITTNNDKIESPKSSGSSGRNGDVKLRTGDGSDPTINQIKSI